MYRNMILDDREGVREASFFCLTVTDTIPIKGTHTPCSLKSGSYRDVWGKHSFSWGQVADITYEMMRRQADNMKGADKWTRAMMR